MITRNQSHEIAVQALYAMLINIKNGQTFEFSDIIANISEYPYSELPMFLKETLLNSLKHYDEIILALTPYLKDWKFARLNLVTQAILIYSYAHFFYIGNVSKAIVINVAIKLSKLYTPDEDYKFINAVLDGVLKHAWHLND